MPGMAGAAGRDDNLASGYVWRVSHLDTALDETRPAFAIGDAIIGA